MTRFINILALTVSMLSTGCIVVEGSAPGGNGTNAGNNTSTEWNASPIISYADAGCWYDSYEMDYVWSFEADIFDDDGQWEIADVFADVFDTWDNSWTDSFELTSWDDYTYTADWAEYQTYLYCGYGDYEVDFVVYDEWDAYDVYTVVPYASL